MEIYIGKDGQVLGPYYADEIQKRLDGDLFDGNEKAWHDGLDEWVNVKELLEDDAPSQEAEEPSVETESAEESEPLDEETLEHVEKIKGLIEDGHADTAWQLIQSLNNPRIYEGLLEDCPVIDGDTNYRWPNIFVGYQSSGGVHILNYLRKNGELFLKLLADLPEEATVRSELKPVRKLILNYVRLSDLDTLSKLTELTVLVLGSNQIADVTLLKHLTQLTELDLSYNQITDVMPLGDLTRLTKLDLSINPITDLTPLKRLTQLTYLHLHRNQIPDLTPLKGLPQLTGLKLGDNPTPDLTPLKGLPQLTMLDLIHNPIEDVSSLLQLTQLKKLRIGGNNISDYSRLAELNNLQILDLSSLNPELSRGDIDYIQGKIPNCQITHCLYTSRELAMMSLSETLGKPKDQISAEDLAQVAEFIYLQGNTGQLLPDLAPIGELTGLKELTVWGDKITDLSPLVGLKKLRRLSLQSEKLSDELPFKDLYPLAGLVELEYLSLGTCDADDLSPLFALKNLKELFVGGIGITSPMIEELQAEMPNCEICANPEGDYL